MAGGRTVGRLQPTKAYEAVARVSAAAAYISCIAFRPESRRPCDTLAFHLLSVTASNADHGHMADARVTWPALAIERTSSHRQYDLERFAKFTSLCLSLTCEV